MVLIRTVVYLILILLFGIIGYAYAEETHEQILRISRHPAKVVPRRVLPITPDMAGAVSSSMNHSTPEKDSNNQHIKP